MGRCPEEAGKKPVASWILHVETALVGGGGEALLLTRSGGAVTTETRKLATILAADVVGFSRLTGADEERTSRG